MSLSQLARLTGLGRSTVIAVSDELQRLGVLVVKSLGDGKTENEYSLDLEGAEEIALALEARSGARKARSKNPELTDITDAGSGQSKNKTSENAPGAEIELVQKSDQSKNKTGSSPEIRPGVVQKLDTLRNTPRNTGETDTRSAVASQVGGSGAKENGPISREQMRERLLETFLPAPLRPRFARWYAEYPKKLEPRNAMAAFKKISPTDELTDQMVAVLRCQKLSPEWLREDGKYIPHPASYLNAGRYLDEIEGMDNVEEQPRAVRVPLEVISSQEAYAAVAAL